MGSLLPPALRLGPNMGNMMPMGTSMELTVQLYLEGDWHDAMSVVFSSPDAGMGSPTQCSYQDGYVLDSLEALGTIGDRAVSVRMPLDFEVWSLPAWPSFLYDLMPVGAARDFWERRLGLSRDDRRDDLRLLRHCCSSPIGHSRIKQAVEPTPPGSSGFTKEEVLRRDTGFLEFAAESGASVGGATGAGGEAPKVLLVEDAAGLFHPEGTVPDKLVVRHWLVKWPRGRASKRDRLVLETEALYTNAVRDIGFQTALDVEHHNVEGGKPSLWMTRFDRAIARQGVTRVAVESLYSVVSATRFGQVVPHRQYLDSLAACLRKTGQEGELSALVAEYVARDLLNVVLGNSDNHGRNTSILRLRDGIRLAPVYDLAPMVMDPEGVTRASHWDRDGEAAGRYDWRAICRSLGDLVPEEELWASLRCASEKIRVLPELLRQCGLPDEVLEFPRVLVRNVPDILGTWGLV